MDHQSFWKWMTYEDVRKIDKSISGVVYVINCIINDKNYVGKTIHSYVDRMYAHRYSSLKDDDRDCAIYNAIQKYGLASFRFMILETSGDDEVLKQREQWYIELFGSFAHNGCNAGYNLTKGGDGTVGYVHSLKARKLISDARKGVPLSINHRIAIGTGGIGRVFSDDHRSKIGDANRDREWTHEARENMRLAKTGTTNVARRSPVEQICLETGNVVARFVSVKEAKRKTNAPHIGDVCRGKRNKSGGFGWRYSHAAPKPTKCPPNVLES